MRDTFGDISRCDAAIWPTAQCNTLTKRSVSTARHGHVTSFGSVWVDHMCTTLGYAGRWLASLAAISGQPAASERPVLPVASCHFLDLSQDAPNQCVSEPVTGQKKGRSRLIFQPVTEVPEPRTARGLISRSSQVPGGRWLRMKPPPNFLLYSRHAGTYIICTLLAQYNKSPTTPPPQKNAAFSLTTLYLFYFVEPPYWVSTQHRGKE